VHIERMLRYLYRKLIILILNQVNESSADFTTVPCKSFEVFFQLAKLDFYPTQAIKTKY